MHRRQDYSTPTGQRNSVAVHCSAGSRDGIGRQAFRIRHRNTVDQAAAVNDLHTAFRDEFERQRVNTVFGLENTGGENFLAVAGMHIDHALDNDRSRIHFRHDEMHGRAVMRGTLRERALVGIEALESGQQRRMNVDDAILKVVSTTSLKRPAPRPADSRLKCLLSKEVGLSELPPWEDGLRRFIEEAKTTEHTGSIARVTT